MAASFSTSNGGEKWRRSYLSDVASDSFVDDGDSIQVCDDSVMDAWHEEGSWDFSLCDICQTDARLATQKYGACCQNKVRRAHNSAKKSDEGKKVWATNRKRGGPPFRDMMLHFDAKRAAFSRGETNEPFDWMEYGQSLVNTSQVKNGSTL